VVQVMRLCHCPGLEGRRRLLLLRPSKARPSPNKVTPASVTATWTHVAPRSSAIGRAGDERLVP
jgi:hypothetical protein